MSRRPPDAAPRETLRLVAEVSLAPVDGSEETRWLRILGDDNRGYLLVGDLEPDAAPALEEFWFPTVQQAFAAAESVGVPRAAWDVEVAPPNPSTGRRD